MPHGPIHPDDIFFHNNVYQFWHAAWKKTFRELENIEHLYSDEFLRSGEKTCITHNDRVIAYFANSWFDLNLLSDRNHSYFKPYPPECIEFLKSQGRGKVMAIGQLAVDPKWRKTEIGPMITELIIWQGYARFLESDADVLVSYTRNDRKINTLAYNYGSRCLREKLTGHNVEIDLTWTLKEDVTPHKDLFIRNVAARLWAHRLIHDGRGIAINRPERLKKIA